MNSNLEDSITFLGSPTRDWREAIWLFIIEPAAHTQSVTWLELFLGFYTSTRSYQAPLEVQLPRAQRIPFLCACFSFDLSLQQSI